MLYDGISLVEGSDITNATVDSGPTFPLTPTAGELFYNTGASAGLYVYDGSIWVSGGSSGLSGALTDQIPYMSTPTTAVFSSDLAFTPGSRTLTVGATGASVIRNASQGSNLTISTVQSPTLAGGTINIVTGGSTDSNGGSINLTAGGTFGTGLSGGTVTLTAGAGFVNSNGGQIVLQGGTAAGSGRIGGDVHLRGGVSASNGAGGHITFNTAANTTLSERMRITRDGALSFSGANNGGTSGQVLMSNGQNATPAWASISESMIADGAVLARLASNETVTGSWSFSSPVTGATPTADLHLTTKAYVDLVAQGLSSKPAVRVATTGNLTATYDNGTAGVGSTLTFGGALPSIDGVSLSVGNGVLVKDQTNTAQNGRYNVTQLSPGILTRCGLCDEADEIPGAFVFVNEGTQNVATGWVQTVANASTFVIGTDSITVTQFSSAGTYLAGDGMTLSGSTFNVATASAARIVVNADSIDLATAGTPVTDALRRITTDAYGRVTATAAIEASDFVGINIVPTKLPRSTVYAGTTADRGYRAAISAGVTIPAGVYAEGDAFSLYNDSAAPITITQGAGLTLRQDGTANTGDRTLAEYGTCFIWFNSATEAIINGSIS